jgi:hypothetical protein
MIGYTLGVIVKNLDHVAISDPTTLALPDHSSQLGLQGLQALDTPLNFNQLCTGNGIGGFARLIGLIGEAQQIPDGIQGKPQLSGMTDEYQSFDMGGFINPLIPRRAIRRWQHPDLLIVSDRLGLAPGRLGDPTDGQRVRHCIFLLNLQRL